MSSTIINSCNDQELDTNDCTLLETRKVDGGNLIVLNLPNISILCCTFEHCYELADVFILLVPSDEEAPEMVCHLCKEHYEDGQQNWFNSSRITVH